MSMAELSYDAIAKDVKRALDEEFGPAVTIGTKQVQGDKLLVAIASERFDGMTPRRKQDAVWRVLREKLREKAQRVAVVMVYGSKDLI